MSESVESSSVEPPSDESSAESQWGYRPALDGLRAVAVYLVVAFHSDIAVLRGGFIGVDLFFVLSGYVVTNVLWSEMASTGSIRLRRFYARRMRRLTPAALLCVVGTSLVFVLVAPLPERLGLVQDARASLLYFANWNFLSDSNDYFAASESPSPFLHFWSLSIEEQFYAIFPLALIGLVALGQRSGRRFVVPLGLVLLIAASVGSQVWWSSRNTAWAYYGTDARLYQMLGGCLLAVVLREWWRPSGERRFVAVGAIGLVGLIAASTDRFDVSASSRGLVAAGLSVGIVLGLERARDRGAARVLSSPPLVYLGGISYGTYLWHWPVLLAVNKVLALGPVTRFALGSVLATGLAAASSELFERPVRSAKLLDRLPRATVIVGLGATAITALVIVPPILESRRTPSVIDAGTSSFDAGAVGSAAGAGGRRGSEPDDSGRSGNEPGAAAAQPDNLPTGFRDPVPTDIDYEAIRSFRIDTPDCPIDDLSKCTVRRGNGPHVLVIGDSVAQMFVPALRTIADTHDWTLSINVWPGCTWQDGVGPRPDLGTDLTEPCVRRRAEWYPTAIEALQPDVIVLSSLNRDDPERWSGLVVGVDEELDGAPPAEVLAATSMSTLDFLARSDSEVIIIEPTPIAPNLAGPTVCLGGATTIGQCSFELNPPTPTELLLRDEAATRDQVETIDLDPIICPDAPICMPIIDGTVTWRDDGHLNHAFVEVMTPALERLLYQTEAFEQ